MLVVSRIQVHLAACADLSCPPAATDGGGRGSLRLHLAHYEWFQVTDANLPETALALANFKKIEGAFKERTLPASCTAVWSGTVATKPPQVAGQQCFDVLRLLESRSARGGAATLQELNVACGRKAGGGHFVSGMSCFRGGIIFFLLFLLFVLLLLLLLLLFVFFLLFGLSLLFCCWALVAAKPRRSEYCPQD